MADLTYGFALFVGVVVFVVGVRLTLGWLTSQEDTSLCWLCKHPKADHEVFASMVMCKGCLKSHRDEDCWIAWAVEHE